MENNVKTYSDSYLYNNKLRRLNSEDKRKVDRALIDFIMHSQRISKESDSFAGIAQDVKRMQNSSVLYSILMLDNVELCINSTEMPRAFKVFEARDLRFDKKYKVFIDCTGLIEYKDGYFSCRKVDVFVTYLMAAVTYLVYRVNTNALLNNSSITISATSCYIALFDYIIDYLRIIGYAANRKKINYMSGLFFLKSMMGKDLGDYEKKLCAKIADIPLNDINAYDLYFEDGMFDNIANFISFISNTFKLKGLTLEEFVRRWTYLYGTGTQYGCELFTNFSIMLTSAYCGSYVVFQKQIEKCCSVNMVKYTSALLSIAINTFNRSAVYVGETADINDMISRASRRSGLAKELREMNIGSIPNLSMIKEDWSCRDNIINRVSEISDILENRNFYNRASSTFKNIIIEGIDKIESIGEGTLLDIYRLAPRSLDEKDIYDIKEAAQNKMLQYKSLMLENSYEEKVDSDAAKYYMELNSLYNNI